MTLSPDASKSDFSSWLLARKEEEKGDPSYSIAIYSPCLVCQPRIGDALTRYLNEFDIRSDGSSWLFADEDLLKRIREEALEPHEFISSNGNIIVESSELEAPQFEGNNVFQVHLSCKEPSEQGHHLWLNASKIDPNTLTSMIASSFLEWTQRDTSWKSNHSS